MAGVPVRRCPGSSNCPELLSHGQRYCPEHARGLNSRRASRAQRGYGPHHDKLRKHYASRFAKGEAFTCAKCKQPIDPEQGWDLGHTDDRRTYTGPEHASCNRADGGRRGAARTNSSSRR